MKRPLKVFRGNLDGKREVLMACNSMTEFLKATRIGKDYALETDHPHDCGVARDKPRVMLVRAFDSRDPWEPLRRFGTGAMP